MRKHWALFKPPSPTGSVHPRFPRAFPRAETHPFSGRSEGRWAVVFGALAAVEGLSPRADGQSPAAHGQSPATESQSPARRDLSPMAQSQSPAGRDSSPMTQSQSPAGRDSSPTTQSQSPGVGDLSPAIGDDWFLPQKGDFPAKHPLPPRFGYMRTPLGTPPMAVWPSSPSEGAALMMAMRSACLCRRAVALPRTALWVCSAAET